MLITFKKFTCKLPLKQIKKSIFVFGRNKAFKSSRMKCMIELLLLVLVASVQSDPTPTENYVNSQVMERGLFYLYWNFTNTDVLMEMHVKTTGWAGFGLSPNGGMDGSDVIVTWIDSNGHVNFTDRHIRNRDVLIDQQQNWIPILVAAKDGFLVAKFTRKIKICDKTNEDMDIPDGSAFVIYALGSRFNTDGDITYHDFRGTKSVQFTSTLNVKVDIDMSQVETIDYRVNVRRLMQFLIQN